jgi:hypothetical protein
MLHKDRVPIRRGGTFVESLTSGDPEEEAPIPENLRNPFCLHMHILLL